MPTEYETRGKCGECGAVRSLDYLQRVRKPGGWSRLVCQPPLNPDEVEARPEIGYDPEALYRAGWNEYLSKHPSRRVVPSPRRARLGRRRTIPRPADLLLETRP